MTILEERFMGQVPTLLREISNSLSEISEALGKKKYNLNSATNCVIRY